MRWDAIIFDLDGTLVDTIPLYEEAYLHMVSSADASMTSDEFRRVYVDNVHISESLRALRVTQSEIQMRQIRDEYYCNLLRTKVHWFPDAKQLLDMLPANIPLGIMTGSWQHYVDAIGERLPLSQYADTIVTADDMRPHSKPDPHGLLLTAKGLAVHPKNCLYVGDQAFDVETAKNAGAESCLIYREHYTPKDAGDDADIVVESLEELLAH